MKEWLTRWFISVCIKLFHKITSKRFKLVARGKDRVALFLEEKMVEQVNSLKIQCPRCNEVRMEKATVWPMLTKKLGGYMARVCMACREQVKAAQKSGYQRAETGGRNKAPGQSTLKVKQIQRSIDGTETVVEKEIPQYKLSYPTPVEGSGRDDL